ncbi:hypothetical protein GOV12_01310 [Candidatus Pacearchaeota archaeon]|nr:hypothetical protein [Candidatus Pacearchaeota archaeon]
MGRSTGKVIISNIVGILIFLILLGVANLLIPVVNNHVYMSVVEFFNSTLWFMLLLWFIGFINELFWSFYFPFNIIAPIISAVYSIFIIMFFSIFWNFIMVLINIDFNIPFNVLYTIVPLIVLVAGYIIILVRKGKPACELHDKNELKKEKDRLERKKEKVEKRIKNLDDEVKDVSWDEVGSEYKSALFNLGKSINKIFDEHKDKKSGKGKSVKKKSSKKGSKKKK